MSILKQIAKPEDLRDLSAEQLSQLAQEIRSRLIEVTARNGGHIGPNLGVVELTLALHRVFDTPKDRFVFDVSHQGYVHKLITGRNNAQFDKIRQKDGLSGFLCRSESEHDCYGAGHAGTALSAALGMAVARDLRGSDEHVVAICGDAAFTCGITFEALNNVSTSTKRLIVILNDNEWSIARNVGAIARYLNELITNQTYNRLHKDLESFLQRMPGGESLIRWGARAKREAKDFIVASSLFEKFGLRYLGPINGHDTELLEQYLDFARHADEPILLHVLTKKGKGLDVALENPEKFHGLSAYDPKTGKAVQKSSGPVKYQDVFGNALARAAQADKSVVGITAAMPSGTGLNLLEEAAPAQFFDVGIAEEHAVLMAAGMATNGLKPVVAIYSTFLQRAFDPVIHDICLQNLPVVFGMDRAGLSPNDGPTHHGVFDISYLRPVPNAVVMQPMDEHELEDMLTLCLNHNGPTFIRFPRGAATGTPRPHVNGDTMRIGRSKEIEPGETVRIWALGPMVAEAQKVAAALREATELDVGVVNARFAKPLDEERLLHDAASASLLVTMEDHVLNGGFGSGVIETLQERGVDVPVQRFGWPDAFVEHGSGTGDLRANHGLTAEAMTERLLEKLQALEITSATPLSVRPTEPQVSVG
ncbi:MAG: 1-deoxy-D-xylulose-5-phosphate synthase [Opitutales bacterium]